MKDGKINQQQSDVMMNLVDRCIAASTFQSAWSAKEVVYYLGIAVSRPGQTTEVKAWATALLEKFVEQERNKLLGDEDALNSLQEDLQFEWNRASTAGKAFLAKLMEIGRAHV